MPTCLDRADPTPCPGFQPKQCRVHVPHGSPRRRSAWHTSRATALHLARHRLVCRASARARSMIRPRALGSLVTAVNTIASATIAATAQAERIASTHNATVAVAGATPSMSPRAASHTWLPRFMRPGLPLEEDARSRLPIPASPPPVGDSAASKVHPGWAPRGRGVSRGNTLRYRDKLRVAIARLGAHIRQAVMFDCEDGPPRRSATDAARVVLSACLSSALVQRWPSRVCWGRVSVTCCIDVPRAGHPGTSPIRKSHATRQERLHLPATCPRFGRSRRDRCPLAGGLLVARQSRLALEKPRSGVMPSTAHAARESVTKSYACRAVRRAPSSFLSVV